VSVIAGVPDGYDGTLTYSNSLDPIDQNDFGIGPGCTYDDVDPMTPVQTARPPVRRMRWRRWPTRAATGSSARPTACSPA
jgi:hypothetical protein